MSNETERGAASIRIDLRDGQITVTHGTDGTHLLEVSNVTRGTWSELWRLLESCGDVTSRTI